MFKVGDMVQQINWEADGYGLVIEVDDGIVNVLWPGGTVNMYGIDLKVISESR